MRRHPVERLSRRLRRLNNWSMLVAVLSIVLMAVQVESVWAYAPTATSKSWFAPIAKDNLAVMAHALGICISISSAVLLVLVFRRHRAELELDKLKDPLLRGASVFQRPRVTTLLLELFACGVHIPPFVAPLDVYEYNSVLIVRFYLLFHLMRHVPAIFRHPGATTVLEVVRVGKHWVFFLRVIIFEHPFLVVAIVFMAAAVIGSFVVNVFERDNTDVSSRSLWDRVFMFYITMTAVGYGVHVPSSLSGRVVVGIASAVGLVITALTVHLLRRFMDLTVAEDQLVLFLQRHATQVRTENMAAKVIQRAFLYSRFRSHLRVVGGERAVDNLPTKLTSEFDTLLMEFRALRRVDHDPPKNVSITRMTVFEALKAVNDEGLDCDEIMEALENDLDHVLRKREMVASGQAPPPLAITSSEPGSRSSPRLMATLSPAAVASVPNLLSPGRAAEGDDASLDRTPSARRRPTVLLVPSRRRMNADGSQRTRRLSVAKSTRGSTSATEGASDAGQSDEDEGKRRQETLLTRSAGKFASLPGQMNLAGDSGSTEDDGTTTDEQGASGIGRSFGAGRRFVPMPIVVSSESPVRVSRPSPLGRKSTAFSLRCAALARKIGDLEGQVARLGLAFDHRMDKLVAR